MPHNQGDVVIMSGLQIAMSREVIGWPLYTIVIALGQVWRSQKDTPLSASDEWDCGHYIVVLAVDKDYVYFQDPYIRMGKGFVPRSTFQEHWHQMMGGRKAARSPKLMQPAIFVRGEQPARSSIGDASEANVNLGEMSSVTVIANALRLRRAAL